ncbi:MAG: hypothetical protein GZ091_12005 [Paludibacter sp.]|nr:hypothetical protein [Paludibacter sp.]
MKQLTKKGLIFSLIAMFTLASCVTNEVTNLKLSKTSIALNVGQSDSLIATVTLTGDISKQPINWISSNNDIVTIKESTEQNASRTNSKASSTKTIVFTALKSGTTTITLQAGDKTASCEISVNQTSYSFNQAYTSNWGDYYETGNNSFDMYLLENSLSLNDSGRIMGNGTFLYLDFNVAITQNSINEGDFILTNSGAVNTFFPGETIDNQGQLFDIGTRLITLNGTNPITSFIKEGRYSITSKGENFLIEGDLTTEDNEVVHFSYEGLVPVTDQREVPVEISPLFTKGELVYYGEAYKSAPSHNFVAYLATEGVNFEDSVLNGEILMLEFNTPLSVTDSIPNGTYNMITKYTGPADLIPSTLVPGFTTTDGNNWGCWYYGETTKRLTDGNIIVNKTGDQYSINYTLFDKIGSKIYGTFTGQLKYIDGTAPAPSSVSAARVKSNKQSKSISNISRKVMKIKPLKVRR